MITRKEFYFKSSNGYSDIYSAIWLDENKKQYKGIIQLVHGMSEHILKYENFACFMASNGFIVCGNDHIGHGRSVKNKDEFGYFGEGKYNYVKLVKDIRRLNLKIKKMYPYLSITLIGHSMGSFLARDYTYRYPNSIDRSIFIGTSGNNPLLLGGLKMCDFKIKTGKGKERGYFVNKLAFGSYNSKYENVKTEFDWICSDENVVKKSMEDDKFGFIFTYAGYYDLFRVLKTVSSNKWYKGLDKRIPILLMAGKDDPVGNYGKGVTEVYKKLIKQNIDTEIILYNGMRHEILNEKNKFKVYNDILNWIYKKYK